MESSVLVISKDQIKSSDSHFNIARYLQENGKNPTIFLLSGVDASLIMYNDTFSKDSFSYFFETGIRVDASDVESGSYLVRLDPPLLPHQAALIKNAFAGISAINDLIGIFSCQSKIILPMLFKEYGDYRIVTSYSDLPNLIGRWGEVVLKPLLGYGGRGIKKISSNDIDILENCIDLPVIAMKYIPEIVNGEKRLFVVRGEPIGALIRYPAPGGWLTNVQQGGTVALAEVEHRDFGLAKVVAERLARFGINFFAVDFVNINGVDIIIEINVSNPGGFAFIDAAGGEITPRFVSKAFP